MAFVDDYDVRLDTFWQFVFAVTFDIKPRSVCAGNMNAERTAAPVTAERLDRINEVFTIHDTVQYVP